MKELTLYGTNLVALIDDEDYNRVNIYKWSVTNKHGRVSRCYRGTKGSYRKRTISISLANEIMNNTISIFDHKDNNPFNFQKYNLRIATKQQNNFNKSKQSNTSSIYKGVSWNRKRKLWQSYITFNYKKISLGYFASEIEAAKQYNLKAIELFGEFANLNVIC